MTPAERVDIARAIREEVRIVGLLDPSREHRAAPADLDAEATMLATMAAGIEPPADMDEVHFAGGFHQAIFTILRVLLDRGERRPLEREDIVLRALEGTFGCGGNAILDAVRAVFYRPTYLPLAPLAARLRKLARARAARPHASAADVLLGTDSDHDEVVRHLRAALAHLEPTNDNLAPTTELAL